ncbi:MAG: hypothetical protein ACQEXJ_07755 [Myxococcota bacterium]
MDDRDQEPLAPDLAVLLDAERRAPGAPEGVRERVRARVERTVGAGGGAAGGGGTTGGGGVALAAKVAVAGVLVAGGVWLARPAEERTPRPAEPARAVSGAADAVREAAGPGQERRVEAPAPPASKAAEPTDAGRVAGRVLGERTIPAPVEPTPRKIRARSRQEGAPAARTPEPARDLEAERRILDRARSARSGGEPEAALAALREHRSRFPRGLLAEEREVLHLRVLADRGRPDEVLERGRRFLERHPRSIHRSAVEALMDAAAR